MSDHAYVATKRCGCLFAAILVSTEDDLQERRGTAKQLGRWVRDGFSVEQHDVEWVRENLKRCPHGKKPAAEQAPPEPVPLDLFEPARAPAPELPPAPVLSHYHAVERNGRAIQSPCPHECIKPEMLVPGHLPVVCVDCGKEFRPPMSRMEARAPDELEPEPAA